MNVVKDLPFLKDLPPFAQEIVLNIILFITAIILVFMLHKALSFILIKPLRATIRRTNTNLDEAIIDLMMPPLRLVLVGLSLIITVHVFNFGTEAKQVARPILRILITGAGFYTLIKIFDHVSLRPDIFEKITGFAIPARLLPFLNTLTKYLLITLGIIFVLQELNFDVAALIASLGVVGIGISLASKDTVSNLFGFAAIVTDNPFEVGDFIKTPNVTGIVEQVGVRSTRVRQSDQALVTVPNNLLTNAVVLNLSRLSKRRLDITLRLTYDTNANQIRTLTQRIHDLLTTTDDVDPKSVSVHFVEFNTSSLDITAVCKVLLVDNSEFTARKEAIYLDIMEIVEALGLRFAMPSQSIYIEHMPNDADRDNSHSHETR
jgi:MscS family membrane protein